MNKIEKASILIEAFLSYKKGDIKWSWLHSLKRTLRSFLR